MHILIYIANCMYNTASLLHNSQPHVYSTKAIYFKHSGSWGFAHGTGALPLSHVSSLTFAFETSCPGLTLLPGDFECVIIHPA